MATTANRVNIAPVNRRALRKYGEFWRALQLVGNAVAEAEKLAAKAGQSEPVQGSGNWAVPTADELRRAAKKTGQSLHVMSGSAKKWEAELISREWRR
jgi:hypothetical protein